MSTSTAGAITWRWVKQQQVYLAATTHLRGVMGKGQALEEALAALQEAIRSQDEATPVEGRPLGLLPTAPAKPVEIRAG